MNAEPMGDSRCGTAEEKSTDLSANKDPDGRV
jgi:hypothetical protein